MQRKVQQEAEERSGIERANTQTCSNVFIGVIHRLDKYLPSLINSAYNPRSDCQDLRYWHTGGNET